MRLKQLTKKTINDIDILVEKMKNFRQRGWTEDVEEFQEGVRCGDSFGCIESSRRDYPLIQVF